MKWIVKMSSGNNKGIKQEHGCDSVIIIFINNARTIETMRRWSNGMIAAFHESEKAVDPGSTPGRRIHVRPVRDQVSVSTDAFIL